MRTSLRLKRLAGLVVFLCAPLLRGAALHGVVHRDNAALWLELTTTESAAVFHLREERGREVRADSAGCLLGRKCLHPLSLSLSSCMTSCKVTCGGCGSGPRENIGLFFLMCDRNTFGCFTTHTHGSPTSLQFWSFLACRTNPFGV